MTSQEEAATAFRRVAAKEKAKRKAKKEVHKGGKS